MRYYIWVKEEVPRFVQEINEENRSKFYEIHLRDIKGVQPGTCETARLLEEIELYRVIPAGDNFSKLGIAHNKGGEK